MTDIFEEASATWNIPFLSASLTSLVAVAAVLLFIAQVCAAEGPQMPSILDWRDLPSSSERPLVVRSDLRIDTENALRDVTPLGELEGVQQLRALVNVTAFEEEWAYIVDRGVWVEIGNDERVDPTGGPQVQVDQTYLSLLIRRFHHLHLYQIHPSRYFAADFSADRVPPPETPVGDLDEPSLAMVGLALPSPSDVAGAISIGLLQEEADPSSDVSNLVVSPYGTIDFELTASGRKEVAFHHGDPRSSLEQGLVLRSAVRRAPFNITQTSSNHPTLSIDDLVTELCAQMTDGIFTMVRVDQP